jgi:hypothetical protein
MKRVIVNLDEAEFYLSSIKSVFALTKEGMTRRQKDTYQNKLSYLEKRITKAKEQSEYDYAQETLEELHNDSEVI